MNTSYIHGFSETEQQRLSAMQDILNQRQIERMKFSGVDRVLDVGSGLGQLTCAIKQRLAADSTVIGIEKNVNQRDAAVKLAATHPTGKSIDFRLGDAYDLPLANHEMETFDLVHARFILEHLSDPQKAIEQMVKALRNTGQICLVDDDHELLQLYPECPPLKETWTAYWNSYYDLGHDPLIGRKVPAMLKDAGINHVYTDTIHYGASAGEQCYDLIIDNLLGVIVGSAEHLIDNNRVSIDQLEQMQESVSIWRQNPQATVWYSLPIAVGKKH